jgi:hypothetical protein
MEAEMGRSGRLLVGTSIIAGVIIFMGIMIKILTGSYDEGIKLFTSIISAALVGLGATVFRPFIRDVFRDYGPPGLIKVLVYGHSGSGKSTFIENALAYEEARPPETFDFVTYSAKINMSLRPVVPATGSDDTESKRATSYEAEAVDVVVADYRGQDPRQVITRPDPDFFGPRERREINALLFFVDFFPTYFHEVTKIMYNDEETIAEVTKGGPGQTEAIIRERAKAHSEYLSRINIGFLFDVAFSPNLRCVKLLINKVDLLTKIVRMGRLPGVSQANYRQFEEALFGEIRKNIVTTCKDNGIRNFTVERITATEVSFTHKVLKKVISECSTRRK